MIGTIVKYDRTKGYGFVMPDDDGVPDHFIIPRFLADVKHPRFLMNGWRVEFDTFEGDRGLQAHNVRIVSKTIAVQRSAPIGGNR